MALGADAAAVVAARKAGAAACGAAQHEARQPFLVGGRGCAPRAPQLAVHVAQLVQQLAVVALRQARCQTIQETDGAPLRKVELRVAAADPRSWLYTWLSRSISWLCLPCGRFFERVRSRRRLNRVADQRRSVSCTCG